MANGITRKRKTPAAVLIVLLVGMTVFFMSVHVVTDGPIIVAKDSLSFADTFVSVDDCIQRYNSASLSEQAKLRQTKLNRALIARGWIRVKKISLEELLGEQMGGD